MPYRPSPETAAKHRQRKAWSTLPDSVFEDLGIGREQLAEFSHALLGSIVLPGEGAYVHASRMSFQITARFPRIIVYCNTEADIRLCLEHARRYGWWVVPRSGGHSTAGFSVNEGMVIDVSRMNSVHVDPETRTATVGSGARFGLINAVLNSYRLHVPGGICPDVGVAGYMQGGGYCYTSRRFGMNCDNVVRFRMMLHDGRTVRASATENADLFWAVRGGTGNNFGILLDITYRLHPVWRVWAFAITWPREDIPRVLAAVQSRLIRTGGPSDLGFMGFISNRADLDNTPYLSIRGLHLGGADAGRRDLAALLEIGSPTVETDTTLPYIEALAAIDEADLVDIDWDDVREDKQACYIDKPPSEADWRRIVDYFARSPAGTVNLACFEPYGGAIARPAPDACAFMHRDPDFGFFVDTFWTDEADADAAGGWLDGFMDLVAPFCNGHAYQNYPRRGLPDTNHRYFGGNIDRLLAVKNKYDPRPRMFHFEQGLATSADDPGAFVDGPPSDGFAKDPIVYEPHNRDDSG